MAADSQHPHDGFHKAQDSLLSVPDRSLDMESQSSRASRASNRSARSSVSVAKLSANALVEEIKRANETLRQHPDTKRKIYHGFGRFIYWWRHPLVRLVAPTYIMTSDFIIHAADPVDHSEIEYQFTPVGEAWNLLNLFNGQPLPLWGHFLKALLGIGALALGCQMPRWLGHCIPALKQGKLMRRGRGMFFVPLFFMGICTMLAAQLWNGFLMFALRVPRPFNEQFYEQTRTPYFTNGFGISARTTANLIDSWVYILDFTAVYMVIDLVLQDGSQYPDACKIRCCGGEIDLRKLWTESWGGQLRIWATWVVFSISTGYALMYTWFRAYEAMIKPENEGNTVKHFWGNLVEHDELGRSLMYGGSFFFDVMTVLQDWEFPTFENELRIALLGTNIAFEGRFANYGMMLLMAFIDFKCLCQNILYDAAPNAQYLDKNSYVWCLTYHSLQGVTLAEATRISDYGRRQARGCFAKLTSEEMGKKGCFSRALARGHTMQLDADTQIWMADGRNACCDVRIRAQHTNKYFQGPKSLFYLTVVMVPVVAAILIAITLASLIARSRREMCRRVVLCQHLSDQFNSVSENMERTATGKKWRVNQDFVKFRREALQELESNDREMWLGRKQAPQKAGDNGEDGGDPEQDVSTDDETSDELSKEYPVRLRRPPAKCAPLLLVCSRGVYSIHAGLTATVEDLFREMHNLGLHDGIRAENVRLRNRPWQKLPKDFFIGRLLPRHPDSAECIYVHARLSFRPATADEEDEVAQWPQRMAEGAARGIGAALPRVWTATRNALAARATIMERFQVIREGFSDAGVLLINGGSAPSSPPDGHGHQHRAREVHAGSSAHGRAHGGAHRARVAEGHDDEPVTSAFDSPGGEHKRPTRKGVLWGLPWSKASSSSSGTAETELSTRRSGEDWSRQTGSAQDVASCGSGSGLLACGLPSFEVREDGSTGVFCAAGARYEAKERALSGGTSVGSGPAAAEAEAASERGSVGATSADIEAAAAAADCGRASAMRAATAPHLHGGSAEEAAADARRRLNTLPSPHTADEAAPRPAPVIIVTKASSAPVATQDHS